MKKYYLTLTFSSIAIFILAMVAFFTLEYIAYAIALAIYIVIGNIICFIIMYITNKYTQKLIFAAEKHVRKIKEELSIISHT